MFPQNCKDFPPKAKFPGNEIPKFHFFPHGWLFTPFDFGPQCSATGNHAEDAFNTA